MSLESQAHFDDYWPPDFGWGGRNDPASHPDMLVAFHHSGVNFGQVHKYAAGLFTCLLNDLVPHVPGGLHASSCWGYSTTDNLPDGTRSFHSFGLAIDVNWNVNHMGTNIPDASGKWAIPRPLATSLARKYGLEWGGNWRGGYHDNMHFEVHLPPDVARTVQPVPPPPVTPITAPTEGAMPILVRVDHKDAAKQKLRWPGYFEFRADGSLVHIPTPARLYALRALGCPTKTITVAQYRALGGK